jgi:hypothetical protein
LIETGIALAFLLPLMVSAFGFGLNMTKSIQVTQVVRDAGHMYARSTDFSLAGNKQILARLAIGMGMEADGGEGVVILSKITKIEEADCTAASLTAAQCVNKDKYVVVQRQVVGNPLFYASRYCSPPNTSLNLPEGNAKDVHKDDKLQVQNIDELPTLKSGQYAYVVEGYFKGLGLPVPDLGIGDLLASRAVF